MFNDTRVKAGCELASYPGSTKSLGTRLAVNVSHARQKLLTCPHLNFMTSTTSLASCSVATSRSSNLARAFD